MNIHEKIHYRELLSSWSKEHSVISPKLVFSKEGSCYYQDSRVINLKDTSSSSEEVRIDRRVTLAHEFTHYLDDVNGDKLFNISLNCGYLLFITMIFGAFTLIAALFSMGLMNYSLESNHNPIFLYAMKGFILLYPIYCSYQVLKKEQFLDNKMVLFTSLLYYFIYCGLIMTGDLPLLVKWVYFIALFCGILYLIDAAFSTKNELLTDKNAFEITGETWQKTSFSSFGDKKDYFDYFFYFFDSYFYGFSHPTDVLREDYSKDKELLNYVSSLNSFHLMIYCIYYPIKKCLFLLSNSFSYIK